MLVSSRVLSFPDAAERSRLLAVNEIREGALERLYERRAAVDDLIRSLETYQRSSSPARGASLEVRCGRALCD